MFNYFTFMRKELTENIRTKRLLVLGCVFIFFAVTSPLLARYMGEFINFLLPAGDEAAQLLVQAMPPPAWEESYAQFYGNIGQVGVIVVLFMYMGTVQREIKSGTASLMFSKGMGFAPFILAKFTMAVILTAAVTIVSAFISYIYTLLLFNEAGQIGDIILSSVIFSAGILMLLAVVILCSCLTKSSAVSGGISFGVYFTLLISTLVPRIGQYSPFQLFNHPVAISIGYSANALAVNLLLAGALAIAALFFSIERLKKAES
jgi:ABC-2 type transport system permease protein